MVTTWYKKMRMQKNLLKKTILNILKINVLKWNIKNFFKNRQAFPCFK
jgi:hypothetical protein